MQQKMEQDRIPGWNESTAGQWAAMQAHALTLRPVSQRLGLWQANNSLGEGFTQGLDLLLKDIVQKHQGILRDM